MRALVPHIPFWDAPAQVWRCAWCGLAKPAKRTMVGLRCTGLPIALRLALRLKVPSAWARAATAPEQAGASSGGHRLWARGQWTWCALCGGCSRKRLQLLATPCSKRMANGRAARLSRLWSGLEPCGLRRPLPGVAPRRVHHLGTAGVGVGWQHWEQGVASLLGASDVCFDAVFACGAARLCSTFDEDADDFVA